MLQPACVRTPTRAAGSAAVLSLRDLHVTYAGGPGTPVRAVRGVSLEVSAGQAVAVVGESGSGKTTLGRAAQLLFPAGVEVAGSVRVGGQELVGASARVLRRVRWRRVASVAQSPGRGFNPVRRIRAQVAEPLRLHLGLRQPDAYARSEVLAEAVGLDPDLMDRYPHQVSGGQAQRAMLAMALGGDPDVLVLDEPTSGLDSVTRDGLVATLRDLRERTGLALLLLTHDLSVAASLVDDVAVLYAGMVMEQGGAQAVLGVPRHPYTRDLVRAYPLMSTHTDLRAIRGVAPDPRDPPSGCPYHPRCTQAIEECATWSPGFELVAGRRVLCVRRGIVTLVEVDRVQVSYDLRGGARALALDDVSCDLQEGEVLAIVGPTGSGKTTLAHVVLGLVEPQAGVVRWNGVPLAGLDAAARAQFRRQTALVEQDPFAATNPRMTVAEVVQEPLDAQHVGSQRQRRARVREVLGQVGLPESEVFLHGLAHRLSGGQLQRVVVARALSLEPRLLIADEPTSMLDASEQARLMRLLSDLQVQHGMSLLLVSHDLALVRKSADRIVVLDAGRVVESGAGHAVVTDPTHPLTRNLVAASSRLEFAPRRDGEPPAASRPLTILDPGSRETP